MTPDLFNLIFLALGLGFLGFIEPCTIGAHMLFLNSQCDRSLRMRVGALAAFMLARLLVMGGFGGVIVMLGQRMIGLQTGAWLIFGALYMVIGIVFLFGAGGRFRRRIRIAPVGWRITKNPWVQGVAFGLNIPACAAPILFGLMGAATATGSAAKGFIVMAVFALSLSLPLVPFSVVPRLTSLLVGLADWMRPRRWLTGFVFVALGLWSIWFGLFVNLADWAEEADKRSYCSQAVQLTCEFSWCDPLPDSTNVSSKGIKGSYVIVNKTESHTVRRICQPDLSIVQSTTQR